MSDCSKDDDFLDVATEGIIKENDEITLFFEEGDIKTFGSDYSCEVFIPD